MLIARNRNPTSMTSTIRIESRKRERRDLATIFVTIQISIPSSTVSFEQIVGACAGHARP
jgi:hypothetical protein